MPTNPSHLFNTAAAEAYALAKSTETEIDTIIIKNPNYATLRLANGGEELTATLEAASPGLGATVIFEGVQFKFRLPKNSTEGHQNLELAIENTDRRISEFVKAVKGKEDETTIEYRSFMLSDLTQPTTSNPLELTMIDIEIQGTVAVAKAVFWDLVNRPFLNTNYTRETHPGLGG